MVEIIFLYIKIFECLEFINYISKSKNVATTIATMRNHKTGGGRYKGIVRTCPAPALYIYICVY